MCVAVTFLMVKIHTITIEKHTYKHTATVVFGVHLHVDVCIHQH